MNLATLFLYRDEKDEAGLRYAMQLAKHLEAPLEVFCALPDPSNVYAYSTPEFAIGISTHVSRQIIEEQETAVADSKAICDRLAGEEGLAADRVTFTHKTGYPPRVAEDIAPLTDALIFPRAASKAGHALSGACEHVLMDCALPVVVSGSEPSAKGAAIVAWDGSEEAARAVRLHLPLLQAADRIIIAQGDKGLGRQSGRPSQPPEVLQAWLKSKGMEAGISALSGPVGKGLLELAESTGASLIVSGAYGHSRAGEYLFGGVTRTLMHAEKAPALALCH